jgi:hypothetical protein
MTPDWKRAGDRILQKLIRQALPFGTRWIATVYFAAVTRFGHSFDTCASYEPKGASDEQRAWLLCRHGMRMPTWMWRRLWGSNWQPNFREED